MTDYKSTIAELHYLADWAKHHLDKAKIANDAAGAIEALQKEVSTLDVLLEECKMDWSGDVTQLKAEHKREVEALQAENERLKADRERDAFRLVWAMNWMRMSVHDHGFTKHVLERGGTADYSDCATYIDKCTTATQEADHGIHAKGGQHEDA